VRRRALALAGAALPDPADAALLCAGVEQRELLKTALERSAVQGRGSLYPCVYCPRWYHREKTANRKKECLPRRQEKLGAKDHFTANACAFLCPVHYHLRLPGDAGEGEEPLEAGEGGGGGAEGEDAAGGGRRISEALREAAKRAAAGVRELPLPPDAAPLLLEDDQRHFRYPVEPFDAEVEAWRYAEEKPLAFDAIRTNMWPPELRVRVLLRARGGRGPAPPAPFCAPASPPFYPLHHHPLFHLCCRELGGTLQRLLQQRGAARGHAGARAALGGAGPLRRRWWHRAVRPRPERWF
jgi:hypothetical protein